MRASIYLANGFGYVNIPLFGYRRLAVNTLSVWADESAIQGADGLHVQVLGGVYDGIQPVGNADVIADIQRTKHVTSAGDSVFGVLMPIVSAGVGATVANVLTVVVTTTTLAPESATPTTVVVDIEFDRVAGSASLDDAAVAKAYADAPVAWTDIEAPVHMQ